MARKALLITPDLCIGCRGCQVACKSWNDLPAEKTKNNGTHENPPDLTGYTYNRIRFIEKVNEKGEVQWLFVSHRCLHCGEPACVEICPVKALKKDAETGIVYYDKNQCIGCQACQAACPFNIPRYDKNGKISKCHFCIDRVKAGLSPACVKTCPTGAIKYGNREEIIKEAKAEGYSVLYGETELGGLGVVYALKASPKEYNLAENPKKPENLIAMGQMLRTLIEKGVALSPSVLKDIGLIKG
ncbi:4Fe-4S dicluster domain-containing protein [Thermodesulfobacterium thermophilum]|uniref:4Fe-4S dicluster domain-containing protein n=1 Tax=Thermodesulfobacterium thermophilum TaxID=886 RepID=UPI0003B462BE|nr:4Fe-4S dicluster domain-containing protein [Thermodesulfobacterium thermophilum]